MHLDALRRAVPAGRARVVAATPLVYTDGANAALNAPPTSGQDHPLSALWWASQTLFRDLHRLWQPPT